MIIIFIVVVILILSCISNHKEYFKNNDKTILLFGDSIIKNDKYVIQGQSVDMLAAKNKERNVVCLAQDDSKIEDVYYQITQAPEPETVGKIFLSVGGNDILQNHLNLEEIFKEYEDLIDHIGEKYGGGISVCLFDLYYPTDSIYKTYYPIIKKWNKMQEGLRGVTILKISEVLTESSDFTFGIEPSEKGSKKIVELMF